jgi:hypothetical protein
MATWSNDTKNSSAFVNQDFGGASRTWDGATESWDDNNGTWNDPSIGFTNQSKSSTSFTNQTKS